MATTFADQLRLFALSVDVLGEVRFNRINRLIEEYCRETLDIERTKLYLASEVDGQPALKRYGLRTTELENVRPVRDREGGYNTQTALAFDKRRPLWIVSAEGKQKLENCSAYGDQWSGLKAIPRYRPIGTAAGRDELATRTSIILPIVAGRDALGVLSFETSDYIEATDAAKLELTKIAETVSILLRLFRANESQKVSTETALEDLQRMLSRPLPKLTKPKIFLASSALAEADVIEAVRSVLNESAYAERLDLVYWKAMGMPGNINRQLLEAIASCRYGICYFSQEVEEDRYADNPNVLFEAGMFHGRVDEMSPSPASWIPIREKQSPDLPFDFAQERVLQPERKKDGELKTAAFSASLRVSLDAILASGSA